MSKFQADLKAKKTTTGDRYTTADIAGKNKLNSQGYF